MEKYLEVTQSRMPEMETFLLQCGEIFKTRWLTNNGSCVRELEQSLGEYLSLPNVLSCNNGTTALMLAIHCAGLAQKKVALTPYTYVATLSALLWMGCTPVFVDVDPDTLCLSPDLLRQRLRDEPDIAGVLPVHIYGLACDVEQMEEICRERCVKLIYDAAQAFGSRYNGRSLLDYGDYSICSFHATKVFHTAEGGCVICHSDEEFRALALARAFGHVGDTHYSLGINGKLSELHAAVGLALLPGTDEEIRKRKNLHAIYDESLEGLDLVRISTQQGLEWNNAYYPILLQNEQHRLAVEQALQKHGVHPRRYFYPALNMLPYLAPEYKASCPVAESAAQRVLCLPMFGNLLENEIINISKSIRDAFHNVV